MNQSNSSYLKQLPSVQKILDTPEVLALQKRYPRWAIVKAVQQAIDKRRKLIQSGTPPSLGIEAKELEDMASGYVKPSLCKVVNATGVVLHTNLGRAPLCEEAIQRVVEVARGYSNLEFDLAKGARGSRHSHIANLLAEIGGAEDAAVVNNNAAAILLALSTFANGKSVLVSRGELVEIGGSFRIPEILALSGATLVEVGATNRTHLADYERAFSEEVSVLLKVHRSNFALVGFVKEPGREELVELVKKHQSLFIEDLGSGCLLEESFGNFLEPTPKSAMQAGVDIVTISGDKLLGGPQAGILLGKASLIKEIKKHPLARAVRVDKMTLAALEATVALYRDAKSDSLPILGMLRASQAQLLRRAKRLLARLRKSVPSGKFQIEKVVERVGGGALPLATLPGAAISCQVSRYSATKLERFLRQSDPPVLGRIEQDKLFLHLRTLQKDEEKYILSAFSFFSENEPTKKETLA